jgi:hypothetical protein
MYLARRGGQHTSQQYRRTDGRAPLPTAPHKRHQRAERKNRPEIHSLAAGLQTGRFRPCTCAYWLKPVGGAWRLKQRMDHELGGFAGGRPIDAQLKAAISHTKSARSIAGTALGTLLHSSIVTRDQRHLVVEAQDQAIKIADSVSKCRLAQVLRARGRCETCGDIELAHARDGCGTYCAAHCECFEPVAVHEDDGGAGWWPEPHPDPVDLEAQSYARQLGEADDGAVSLLCSGGVLYRLLQRARDSTTLTKVRTVAYSHASILRNCWGPCAQRQFVLVYAPYSISTEPVPAPEPQLGAATCSCSGGDAVESAADLAVIAAGMS